MKVVHVVGGLASQMMAYALYLALKNNYPNEKVICDFSSMLKYGNLSHNGEELTKVFDIKESYLNSFLASIVYSNKIFFKIIRKLCKLTGFIKFHDAIDKKYNYDESVFKQTGTVIYYQCWTSWKYFVDVENLIKEKFKFRGVVDSKNIKVLDLINSQNSVAVHIRRGDYVGKKFSAGLVDNIEYYRTAFEIINKKINNPHYFLFSNDPEWVSKNLVREIRNYPVKHIYWNQGNNSYLDMQLMSNCKHHVIANSGFSWWAAYLANSYDQIVIAPKHWSGDYSTGIELRDMNLPNWIIIDNQ